FTWITLTTSRPIGSAWDCHPRRFRLATAWTICTARFWRKKFSTWPVQPHRSNKLSQRWNTPFAKPVASQSSATVITATYRRVQPARDTQPLRRPSSPARNWSGVGERMLRIGCVKYLNARPLIRGWPGSVEFDHPSTLCKRLAKGQLDVALVSSFEFLRNPIYRIIDFVSISSDGPVYSVVVAHRGEISEIDEIGLDPASETAVNLLRCLLAEVGFNPRLVQRNTGVSPAAAESCSASRAQLLIGDQAIRFRHS